MRSLLLRKESDSCGERPEIPPFAKAAKDGAPWDGEFEKKRDKVGHLSNRHGSVGSKEAPRAFLPIHGDGKTGRCDEQAFKI